MKNLIKIIIVVIFLSSCKEDKNFEIQNYDKGNIKLKCELIEGKRNGRCFEFYENGQLHIESNWKDNKAFGQEITYSKKGDVEEIGQYYNNRAVGFFSKYHNNVLYHLRQYIIVENESYVNQYWNFDENGNLLYNKSNYYSLKISCSDTISLQDSVLINIKLDAPHFSNGKMQIILGKFDEYFNLIDTTSQSTIFCNDFQRSFYTKFTKLGDNYIRGIIINYKYDKAEDITEAREIYFEKKLFVVK